MATEAAAPQRPSCHITSLHAWVFSHVPSGCSTCNLWKLLPRAASATAAAGASCLALYVSLPTCTLRVQVPSGHAHVLLLHAAALLLLFLVLLLLLVLLSELVVSGVSPLTCTLRLQVPSGCATCSMNRKDPPGLQTSTVGLSNLSVCAATPVTATTGENQLRSPHLDAQSQMSKHVIVSLLPHNEVQLRLYTVACVVITDRQKLPQT